jgi:hypothetical protein
MVRMTSGAGGWYISTAMGTTLAGPLPQAFCISSNISWHFGSPAIINDLTNDSTVILT